MYIFMEQYGKLSLNYPFYPFVSGPLSTVCLYLNFQLNAHAMHNALSPDTRPWVELGRSLGVAAATLGNNSKQGITVTAYGEKFIVC